MSSNGKHEDPAPSHTELPRERVKQWIDNISMLSCEQLRHLRDQTDDQLRAIQDERERVKNECDNYADWCQSVIEFQKVVTDAMVRLINPKWVNLPELPKTNTITDKRPKAETDPVLAKYAPKQSQEARQ